MSYTFSNTEAYKKWLSALKTDIQHRQIKAAVRVNTELLLLYWDLGKNIIEKQQTTSWGEALIPQLARDLANAFPGVKGFSRSNLFYIKKWVQFYDRAKIVPQAVGQFQKNENQSNRMEHQMLQQFVLQLPWGHNRVIIDKCKTIDEAEFYVQHTLAHNWSRAVLIHQIESRLHLRKANAQHNFEHTLDKIQAELAHETLKNPYNFDFLTMGSEAKERDIETALVNQLKKFLLELGQGFAFLGQQYPLHVGEDSFYLDLLFYHARLHCYIVVEIKTTAFQPEFVGKLNFYLAVVP
jgi:predicted nuclease of restriction endonuclease-like (RecB) superfamily